MTLKKHKTYLTILILFLSFNCKNETKETEIKTTPIKTEVTLDVIGNYVSKNYSKRNEGFDWIAVSVTNESANNLNISIRSRADKKKPTCTFNTVATKIDDKNYQSESEGKNILFKFNNTEINITPKKEEDQNILYFYCSGGVSIGGTYSKLNEELDQTQIDKIQFSKILNIQNVGFNISVTREKNTNLLTIFTFGLEVKEYNETLNISNEKVINAEVEDFDMDGSPELFIYTESLSKEKYGNVYAFSVNNKKSMSPIYFEKTLTNNKINQGYKGNDTFTLIEQTLGQRFPIYKQGNEENKPSGGIRQVLYKLVKESSAKKLVIKKITEY